MLTFDRAQMSTPGCDDLGMLLGPSPVPDIIECGENNAVWIRVRRSTKTVELASKQTGRVVTSVLLRNLTQDHALYGLTDRQVGCCFAALKLRPSDAT